ncbi:MAG: hypothetical protein ACREEP_16665 [Dongiaceae bacterium]
MADRVEISSEKFELKSRKQQNSTDGYCIVQVTLYVALYDQEVEGHTMQNTPTLRIAGIFADLRRFPWRVAFRRVGSRWERYDIVEPYWKIDALVMVIEELCKEIPAYVDKLVSVDERYRSTSSHRRRQYVHYDRAKLYAPDRIDLASRYSRPVAGIWLATNIGTREIRQVMREACEAAGIEFRRLTATAESFGR